jgi:hypothetical protein
MCDDFGRIAELAVGWPGSVHDNQVWLNSEVCKNLEDALISMNIKSLPYTLHFTQYTLPCSKIQTLCSLLFCDPKHALFQNMYEGS